MSRCTKVIVYRSPVLIHMMGRKRAKLLVCQQTPVGLREQIKTERERLSGLWNTRTST